MPFVQRERERESMEKVGIGVLYLKIAPRKRPTLIIAQGIRCTKTHTHTQHLSPTSSSCVYELAREREIKRERIFLASSPLPKKPRVVAAGRFSHSPSLHPSLLSLSLKDTMSSFVVSFCACASYPPPKP